MGAISQRDALRRVETYLRDLEALIGHHVCEVRVYAYGATADEEFPRSGECGLRVAEVSYIGRSARGKAGASYMQMDVPEGIAVCALVERCVVAQCEDWDSVGAGRIAEEFSRLGYAIHGNDWAALWEKALEAGKVPCAPARGQEDDGRFTLDVARLREILGDEERVEAELDGAGLAPEGDWEAADLEHLLYSCRDAGLVREPEGFEVHLFGLEDTGEALVVVDHDAFGYNGGRIASHTLELRKLGYERSPGPEATIEVMEELLSIASAMLPAARAAVQRRRGGR